MAGLKMLPEHYEMLKEAITKVKDQQDAYGQPLSEFEKSYKAAGATPMRFRWDTLNKAGLRAGDSVGMKTGWPVYDYLNDENIDSALKQVFRELNFEWASSR